MESKPGKKFFKYAIPVIRIIIGMAFLLSGILKLIDIKGFREIIETMGLLGGPLPFLASILIPVLEVILGLMLVLGIFIRITALHLNVLVIIFAWVAFYILRNRPDMLCGCFGGFFDMTFSIYHFVILFIIFILNLIIVIEPNDTWTLQKLFRDRITPAKKMLLVEVLTYFLIALGIILIGFAIYINFWGQKDEEKAVEIEDMTIVVEENNDASGTMFEKDGKDLESKEVEEVQIIDMTVDEAYEVYLNDDNFIFVDVRSESEYESGHVKGAAFIPLHEIEDRLAELPKDKSILVYCNGSSCNRSGAAARVLVANGYKKVYDLTGKGIDEWISKGYPSE
jgi:rhodanese-related sulfurtransferase/uncharacterized membrane protein YphA (DoxX/SURF4 family)